MRSPGIMRVRRSAALLSVLLVFLVAAVALGEEKTFEVRNADTAPAIDGFVEEVWDMADSAHSFVQFQPHEKGTPTERTVVYALQDEGNLYLAFRCYADSIKPVACLTSDEDWIAIGIDPFGSMNTAYYFIVYASGIKQDGWVLDDGRSRDDSWEGVWYRGVGIYDDRWEIELKIPYKSIRYKKGLEQWGIQFIRYYAANRETDIWTEATELESEMVSKYGSLTGVTPRATGYNIELYPEAFLRHDEYPGEKGKWEPRLSLNFKWDLTPQTAVSATAFPDFAQIESDPFTLNLSQYPSFFGERRPFFIEGADVFRMSDFGEERDFFSPLRIFYSRRIGKLIDGEAVPIITGLKMTSKSEDWSVGALGVYTDEFVKEDSLPLVEPHRSFGVLRVRRKHFENSELGVLFSGTMADEDDYNYALAFDGVARSGINQFILQGVASDSTGKQGWAVSSGYWGLHSDFIVMGAAEVVHDSFGIGSIGFVPWAGRKTLTVSGGPYRTYQEGFVRNLFCTGGMVGIQEPDQDEWSTLGSLALNPNFRNNWGMYLELTGGRAHESDTNYIYRGADISVWGTIAGQRFNCGGDYEHTYNYPRDFLADRASGWFRVGYSVIPQASVSLQSSLWAEWDPSGSLLALTTLATPRIDCRLNADILTSVFNEFVFASPGADFGGSKQVSNRVGFFFAWNFMPKSWLYLAFNDHRLSDNQGDLQLSSSVGAVKAKYLIYF